MDFFKKRTCKDFLQEIKNHLDTLSQYPAQAPSINAEKELREAAKALADRCLKLIKNVEDLDKKTADAIRASLYLIKQATDIAPIKYQAIKALASINSLDKACVEKLARKQMTAQRMTMKHGAVQTYGRMMSKEEYAWLIVVKELESADPEQPIPAFLAPQSLIEWFFKIDKTATRNMYAQMGGTGHVDYVVFFQTDVIPVIAGPVRNYRNIIEVKFPHGTPVTIASVRPV